MIKLSKKDSDHTDLYKNSKFDSISDGENETSGVDELYKFKKTVSLQRPYEIYLETEKTYQLYKKQGEKNMDPMEIVARKIRREETLYLKDLKYWVAYNFLVFS